MEGNFPDRKHPRLKSDVYDRAGVYFITICTRNRSPCLGKVVWETDDVSSARVVLSEIGMVVETAVREISSVYPDAGVDTFVIMPDHIHFLLYLADGDGSAVPEHANSPSVNTRMVRVVRSLKTVVTKQLGYSIWQTSFYEEILRNPSAFASVRQYILANPRRWALRYGGIPEYVP